jgi:hypothetical protein
LVFRKASTKDSCAKQIKIYEKGVHIIEEVLPLVESLDLEYFKKNKSSLENSLSLI